MKWLLPRINNEDGGVDDKNDDDDNDDYSPSSKPLATNRTHEPPAIVVSALVPLQVLGPLETARTLRTLVFLLLRGGFVWDSGSSSSIIWFSGLFRGGTLGRGRTAIT
jgi:hypothetical protein